MRSILALNGTGVTSPVGTAIRQIFPSYDATRDLESGVKDAPGIRSRVLADSSSGVVVSQSPRLISLVGVHDIVVVDTPDALLVTTREHAQRVKAVVDAIKSAGRSDLL